MTRKIHGAKAIRGREEEELERNKKWKRESTEIESKLGKCHPVDELREGYFTC